jgi:transcriptional regulator with XRE-family HTH domain
MTTSIAVIPAGDLRAQDDDLDLFPDLEPLHPFDIKKDELAANLSALMSYTKKTRSELARELGWGKSRITKVLSGKNNLTLRTICEFTTCLGYDFDVVFRTLVEKRPEQPWQKIRNIAIHGYVANASAPLIDVQTANQVAKDLFEGNHRSHYFSLHVPSSSSSANPVRTIEASVGQMLPIGFPTSVVSITLNIKEINEL